MRELSEKSRMWKRWATSPPSIGLAFTAAGQRKCPAAVKAAVADERISPLSGPA